jgi:hypothetical protein
MNGSEMKKRCPNAIRLGVSMIQDYELRFHYHANIEFSVGKSVPVIVWELQKSDEISLDGYEGYPQSYTKKDFCVDFDGGSIKAMAYIMTDYKINQQRGCPPADEYFNNIKTGYLDARIDLGPLNQALRSVSQISG